MIAAEERDVLVDGLRLRVLAWGAPRLPPVVLLHGGSAHAHWWDFVAARLADRYRLLAPHLRGHGDSAHARPAAYAIDDYVRDLEGLAAALGLDRFALVGHSLGAFVALRHAERNPAAVRRLVLVDGRPRSGTGRRAGLVNRLQFFPHPTFADEEEAIRRFRLLPSATAARAEVLRHVALAGLRRRRDGTLTLKFDRAAFAHYRGIDVSSALASVRCPTLLVRGAESVFVDAPTLAHMAALCPHAETAEIASAHHHVLLDRPEALADRLAAFLEQSLR
jgi:pimeloyl-ACP methyl ester carboxylesterase